MVESIGVHTGHIKYMNIFLYVYLTHYIILLQLRSYTDVYFFLFNFYFQFVVIRVLVLAFIG
jgi:hypothetical protein